MDLYSMSFENILSVLYSSNKRALSLHHCNNESDT